MYRHTRGNHEWFVAVTTGTNKKRVRARPLIRTCWCQPRTDKCAQQKIYISI